MERKLSAIRNNTGFRKADRENGYPLEMAMDFFGQQDRARLITKRLVFLFIAAVVLTVLALYLAVWVILQISHTLAGAPRYAAAHHGWFTEIAIRFSADGLWNWELLGWVALVVLSVLVLGSSYKIWQLARGGAVVAELLGGRLLDLNTTDTDERRLLNVVEEMAIASGLSAPDVYVLEEESGINAFAAGNSPSDAVIAVTFGALKLLTRDEMQGVIAHEFSHILNGDMRLNMRLMGWLHGILGLVVLGRVLTLSFLNRLEADVMPGDKRLSRSEPVFIPVFLPALVLGWGCIVAGIIGAFFARLIKAGISRQREYLADAAALQFTRNPHGIAGALMKIGGLRSQSIIAAAKAEEASHLYFSEGMRRRWFRFTSTHPPLTDRIRRFNPQFDGKYPFISLERVLRESKVTAVYREHGTARPVDFGKVASVIGYGAAAQEMLYSTAAARESSPTVPPVEVVPSVGRFSPLHLEYATHFLNAMPDSLREATYQPFSAVALVYALVCSKNSETRAKQLTELEQTTEPGIIKAASQLFGMLDQLDTGAFLPLVDLCLRALRQLSPEQYEVFRGNLQRLVEHDREIDLFEYMLERMLVRHLDTYFRKVARPTAQYYVLKPLLADCAILLSGLARFGHESEEQARAAFQCGAAQLSANGNLSFLPAAECGLAQVDSAIARAAQGSPRLKQQILNALAWAAATDGQLQKREAELLRAIADGFDSPIPPYLRGALA